MGQVRRASQFFLDVEEQYAYLRRKAGFDLAERWLDALEAEVRMLAEFPLIGAQRQMRVRRSERPVRLWPMKDYLEFNIIYSPQPWGIRALRLIHAKQDYHRFL